MTEKEKPLMSLEEAIEIMVSISYWTEEHGCSVDEACVFSNIPFLKFGEAVLVLGLEELKSNKTFIS